MIKLTKAEKDLVRTVILYYRDTATHEGEIAGLKQNSRSYKVLTSAFHKLL